MRIAKFLTSGGLLTALFVAGFIFSLRSCLSAYDERFALAPVLYFKKDGKEVLFSLVQYNETSSYSSESGMVMKTFTNYYFIQSNNAVTGQKIADNKIKERIERKVVSAQVLGAANDCAWIFIDGLAAYDPFTLQKIADVKMIEDKNPLLKGRLPAEIQYYHFNNEESSIGFTASDGSLWVLDTKSLLAKSVEPKKEDYPVNKSVSVQLRLKSLQRTAVGFSSMVINQDTINGQWCGLYAKDEIDELDGVIVFRSYYAHDTRRQLYTSTYSRQTENNFVLNKTNLQNVAPAEYFLDAGFLINKETGKAASIADPESYFIVYKSNIGTKGKLMLCRILKNGKPVWTQNTNFEKWADLVYKNGRIFIFATDNTIHGNGCNTVLIVNAVSGQMNRYDYISD